MHRLSGRSVSTILRAGGCRRCRNATASISSSNIFHKSAEENDENVRWYSVLTTRQINCGKPIKQLNFGSSHHLLRIRYESTAAASDSSSNPPPEKYEYQAEVSRLMDLIVNSLYSNKEVFLRELISNASDALDKLRFLSVTEPELLKDAVDLDIRIQTDKDNGIVTITDTGIGMTREELVDCLGTIAQSGTAKFLKALKESKDSGGDSNLIGQFGVGFYSAFLVSERVEVSTKSPKSDKQYVWEGEANSSSYTIREETDPAKLVPRGTRLTLYLKRDDKGFAHPERVQKLVKNYSQFVSFPIYTWQEKGYTKEVEVDEDPSEAKKDDQGDKTEKKKKTKTVVEKYWDWDLTNETQPIWLRNPKEVSTEEYNEFYKKTFNEYLEPLASTHFTTEGEVEFRSILYVPSIAPMGKDDIINPKTKNIRLYVKRVFISDDFDGELFPRYLSFIKGVVDSNDLPLNVSREILQESRIIRIMRKRLVRKAFDMINGIAMSENKDLNHSEMVFSCQNYTEVQKVQLATMEFTEYAVVWWDQIKKSRRRNGLPEFVPWPEFRAMMRTRFVPGHYTRDLYHRLQTLVQGNWSVDEYHKEMEILMLQADVQEDPEATMARFLNGLRPDIAERVELQHYMELQELVDKAIKDYGHDANGEIVSEDEAEYESMPPLEGGSDGESPNDEEFSAPRVTFDGVTNKYSFLYNSKKVTLTPLSPKQVHDDQLKLQQEFEKYSAKKKENEKAEAKKRGKRLYIARQVSKEVAQNVHELDTNFPFEVKSLLQEYADIFPEDIPNGLPLLRGIEHQIDFIPRASLPNRPAYKSNPEETKELQRQVDELLAKAGHVRV
nr:heat shock protein 90-6, mitochondrial-like [Coffea arabica]